MGDGLQHCGAKIIHVDPRFTRTSALADLHVPLRAGTDIAFLGGLINHVLTEGREFRDYVVAFTNAAAIIDEDYRDTEDLDGLFSGFNPQSGSYDIDSWQYEGAHPVRGYVVAGENPAVGGANGRLRRRALANLEWLVVRDFTCIVCAAASGLALLAGSLTTRFAVFEAGMASAVDPQRGRPATRAPEGRRTPTVPRHVDASVDLVG